MVDSLRVVRVAPALFLLLVLAACGSSPNARFSALQPVPPSGAPSQADGPPIDVGAVRLPAILDRRELVEIGPGNDVAIRQERRWAAPLDQMSRQVLTRDLAARLPEGMVLAPDEPKPAGGARDLVVVLEQFDVDNTGRVTLDGVWSVSGGRNGQVERRQHEHIVIARAGNQPKAMSEALGRLADRIAGALPPAASSSRPSRR